ncbi:MAG: HAD-IA family hydrolase [Lachnospiraceae bacterium]|nr:HAD-IA family hydrolase [Lachnospiraceae bacterium]
MRLETDGIILDVDGTLWNSTGIVAKAWTRAVRENGCPDMTVTAKMLQALFGRTMDVIAENLLPELTKEHRDRIMKVCSAYEQQALEHMDDLEFLAKLEQGGSLDVDAGSGECRALEESPCQYDSSETEAASGSFPECRICYPGVQQTIRELSEKVPVFIVSNCQCGYIELLLKKTGLGPFVTDIECFGNTGKSKGDNIRLLVGRNGLHSPIYVGDTQGDADAAAQAGIPFVYAAYGFGTADHMDAEISCFAELKEAIG